MSTISGMLPSASAQETTGMPILYPPMSTARIHIEDFEDLVTLGSPPDSSPTPGKVNNHILLPIALTSVQSTQDDTAAFSKPADNGQHKSDHVTIHALPMLPELAEEYKLPSMTLDNTTDTSRDSLAQLTHQSTPPVEAKTAVDNFILPSNPNASIELLKEIPFVFPHSDICSLDGEGDTHRDSEPSGQQQTPSGNSFALIISEPVILDSSLSTTHPHEQVSVFGTIFDRKTLETSTNDDAFDRKTPEPYTIHTVPTNTHILLSSRNTLVDVANRPDHEQAELTPLSPSIHLRDVTNTYSENNLSSYDGTSLSSDDLFTQNPSWTGGETRISSGMELHDGPRRGRNDTNSMSTHTIDIDQSTPLTLNSNIY